MRSRSRETILALLAALVLPAALMVPAAAGSGSSSARRPPRPHAGHQPASPQSQQAPAPQAKPQLLLIHGGSFLVEDPYFRPLTEQRAIAAGFEPHYLTYPLGNMRAAVQQARAAARELRERYGLDRVYVYGASAGGTLAALLCGDSLVDAGVAKAPVSNLVEWQWPLSRYGSEYFSGMIGLSMAARERLSPIDRPQKRPLLVVQGRADNVVPPTMSESFAAKFKRVHLWLVPGGHTTERYRPYLITKALHWLASVARLQDNASGGVPST